MPAARSSAVVAAAAVVIGAIAVGAWGLASQRSPQAARGDRTHRSGHTSGRQRVQPPPTSTTVAPPPRWEIGWGSAMAWGYQTVADATVRDVVKIPVDTLALRVRISNQFGKTPLSVGGASVGRSTSGAGVDAASLQQLHFSGGPSTVIPAGGWALSDPVPLASTAPQALSVSVFVSGTNLMSSHYPCCEASTPSYLSASGSGNLTTAASPAGFGYQAPWSRLVDAVYVERPAPPPGQPGAPGSIVVVGDSISDGFNSTARWPELLQERIGALPVSQRPPVVNEAITANTLTAVTPSDATTGGGPPGLDRLAYDALSFPGVSTVVVFLGTNDLYFGAGAESVIAGLEQAATAAHSAGVRIVAVTLTPRMGSEGWNPERQAELEQINSWLSATHDFDAVVDLYPVLADVYNGYCQPAAMAPVLDSGDHLHPNALGDAVIANAIDGTAFSLPPLPDEPVGTRLTPTPGCAVTAAASA